jgi:hypothetical protein
LNLVYVAFRCLKPENTLSTVFMCTSPPFKAFMLDTHPCIGLNIIQLKGFLKRRLSTVLAATSAIWISLTRPIRSTKPKTEIIRGLCAPSMTPQTPFPSLSLRNGNLVHLCDSLKPHISPRPPLTHRSIQHQNA